MLDSVRIPRRDVNGVTNEDGAEYVVYDAQQVRGRWYSRATVGVGAFAAFLEQLAHSNTPYEVLRIVMMKQAQYDMYCQ
jgi:hypothetical protein